MPGRVNGTLRAALIDGTGGADGTVVALADGTVLAPGVTGPIELSLWATGPIHRPAVAHARGLPAGSGAYAGFSEPAAAAAAAGPAPLGATPLGARDRGGSATEPA